MVPSRGAAHAAGPIRFRYPYGWREFMSKLMVRAALCATLVLWCGMAYSAGETDGPTVKTTKTEKGKESKIHVYLPSAEAKLFFDDTLTKATGKDRSFRSPALEDGKSYSYKVVATWKENGQEVMHETKIVFHAGEDVAVDFRR
jgi:uncharacterized protein (TIGR03000 family)